MTTALADLLLRRIAATGPISLADYMADCLLHPEYGYYTRAEPFGAAGDFITAPEISQMFGELLGLWLAQCWLDQGAPPRFVLAELGPGRGTLMADVLRATRGVPGFHAVAQVVLVEASPRLQAIQHQRLAPHPVSWLDTMGQVPEAPLYLLANEFFDALPIRQFTRAGAGWAETMVALDADRLVLARAAPAPLAALDHRLNDTQDGDIVEVCPAAPGLAQTVASRVAQHGGAALVVDYGGWRSRGDTVQAMRSHAYTGLLDCPGQADLTAHVDFEPLAGAARSAGAATYGPIAQGVLLERLGIAARAARLRQGLSGDRLSAHLAATRRLTHPEEMGTLFQALAILPVSAPLPAGFVT